MSEENSNFHQLLNLRVEEPPEIIEWLRKRDEKYTSLEIQNELLEAMALGMMWQISANIQNATFFTIIADETAVVSSKEQLVSSIRWVDDFFVIHEDFIGMHLLERTNADQIVAVLKNGPLRINLNIQRARGQCRAGWRSDEGRREN